MTARNWREWFVPPEEEPACHEVEDDVRVTAGSGHRTAGKALHLRKKLPPRCASCKQFIGFDTGLHLMISTNWRIHVSCFASVLERHYEDGEVIDFTTGAIHRVDDYTD